MSLPDGADHRRTAAKLMHGLHETSRANREKSRSNNKIEVQKETSDRSIEVINRQRSHPINRREIARLSRKVLDRIGLENRRLTIIFIRDLAMRELNRDYRGIDKPTDVLSFAYHETEDFSSPAAEADHLGDIVISVETAAVYARELGLTFNREIEHLVIHGALHLAGYDHETDNGEMKKLERKLRRMLLFSTEG